MTTPAAIVHIKKSKSFLVPALPVGVDFDRLVATMDVELDRDPQLRQIEPNSLFWGFVHASELGLRVGKVHEQAYIVGFKDASGRKVGQLIIGYKGLIELAYRHPLVHLIDAHVVREKDDFEYDLGTSNYVRYRPNLRESRGRPLCAFAKVLVGGTASSGVWKPSVVTMEDIEAARRCSARSRDPKSPWNTHPDSMWKKTAIRRALSNAPRSTELIRAESIEEAYEDNRLDLLIPNTSAPNRPPSAATIEHEAPAPPPPQKPAQSKQNDNFDDEPEIVEGEFVDEPVF